MGKIIEFKKFSKKINRDNFNIDESDLDVLPDDDLAYVRKEIEIRLDEVDYILDCIYKQILINDKLIISADNNSDFSKLTYLRDFNDKLHDVMYFLTNSTYQDPIIIKINFLEFKYLLGTLQLELDMLNESKDTTRNNPSSDYFKIIEYLCTSFTNIYFSWKNEIHTD